MPSLQPLDAIADEVRGFEQSRGRAAETSLATATFGDVVEADLFDRVGTGAEIAVEDAVGIEVLYARPDDRAPRTHSGIS